MNAIIHTHTYTRTPPLWCSISRFTSVPQAFFQSILLLFCLAPSALASFTLTFDSISGSLILPYRDFYADSYPPFPLFAPLSVPRDGVINFSPSSSFSSGSFRPNWWNFNWKSSRRRRRRRKRSEVPIHWRVAFLSLVFWKRKFCSRIVRGASFDLG